MPLKKKNRNRRALGRLQRLRNLLLRPRHIAVFFAVLGSGLFFASDADSYVKDWVERSVLNQTAEWGFVVKDIYVEGRIHSEPSILRAIINVEEGDPIFSFDPQEAQSLIQRIHWIKNAHVERRLPDTIYIRLHEYKPTALWQDGDKLRLVDEDGAVIGADSLDQFRSLFIIRGEGATTALAKLLTIVDDVPKFRKSMKLAEYIEERRWDIWFEPGVQVKFPGEKMDESLSRLNRFWSAQGNEISTIKQIDLRQDDRIVIRTKPGQVREYKAGFQKSEHI